MIKIIIIKFFSQEEEDVVYKDSVVDLNKIIYIYLVLLTITIYNNTEKVVYSECSITYSTRLFIL